MKVGEKFSTFEELEDAVKAYSDENYVQYYKRESRAVAAAKRKGIKRYINENILVYQVHYHCIKGSRTFKTRSRGERETKTFVDGCPAYFKCCVSADGEHLEVMSSHTEHNHPISQAIYEQLPKQRALLEAVKVEVRQLMQLKANKKLLKQKIQQDTGKVVLLKDLSNLASPLKPATRNDLEQTVHLLQKDYGSDCHVLVDYNNFQGLLISTPSMRNTMAAYPEFLGIDATYKLLDVRTPVYVIHNEDSNGATEVVCVAILVREDECSLKWLLDKFQDLNPSWTKTRCIMADKDLLERDLLKKSFPQAHVLICVFHTLKTFRHEITCAKMTMSAEQRDHTLKLLQRMVYARSDEEFARLEDQLDSTAPASVLEYYNKNWRSIKNEWHKGPQFLAGSFNNTTNNRL
ncbi:hypothetical protein V5799_010127 [Amblyomma americanum]|uniref:MULE transposase domain-containing protein n=1 Tax=Amblyomma americanum TaxID=6943 RepID=A0AAQ4F8I0_AMBAM